MIIEGNQDEIVALLEEYNPKWQDAGQSFADSLLEGLNSEKQTIADTIEETLNIKDTVAEQVIALDELESKINQIKEGDATRKGGAGGGGLAKDFSEIGDAIKAVTGTAEEIGDAIKAVAGTAEEAGGKLMESFNKPLPI